MSSSTTYAMPRASGPRGALALTVVEGPDAGTCLLVEAPTLVGSSEVCGLRLSDRTVSRRHLSAEPSAIGLRVRDQGSRNGTWLGAARVAEVELPPGGEVRVGATRLRVDAIERPASGEADAATSPAERFGRFLGRSEPVRRLFAQLERTAPSDATILLEGESGTGKELLAEAIHDHGGRPDGPFVVVDAGAVPPNLIEAELFGHERGAFTGADRARAGAFEQAHGGTVFLDEIGELPLALQSRLLRVLDRRRVRRLGSDRPLDVDVRVVAATNRNLDREVEEQRFRLDLFHRLAVVVVRVPPLREREGDIELLAQHFLQRMAGDPSLLQGEALERLLDHPWPGNVRELRNHVERLVLLGDVQPASLGRASSAPSSQDPLLQAAESGLPFRKARAQALAAFTEAYVAHMLATHDSNVTRAAEAAGVARRYFQQLKTPRDSD